MLGNIAIVKYLTNTIDVAGYGIYAYGVTIAGIITMLIFGPVAQTVLRFAKHSYEKNQYSYFLNRIISIHIKLNLAIFTLAIAISAFALLMDAEISLLIILTASMLSIADGINRSLNSLNNSFRSRSLLATQKIIESVFKFFTVFIVVALFSKSGNSAFIGFTLGCVASALVNAFLNFRREKPFLNAESDSKENKKLLTEMYSYGYAFPLYAVFGVIFAFSDRLIIENTLGLEQLGIYFAVYQLSSAPVTVLAMFLSQLMAPVLFASHLHDSSGMNVLKQSLQLLTGYTVLYIPILALIFLFSEGILRLFTNDRIANEASNIFPLISIGLFLFHLGQLSLLYGQSLKKTQNYIISKAIHAVCFLAISWFLIKQYALVGIAYSLIVSSFAYLTLNIGISAHLFIEKKKTNYA